MGLPFCIVRLAWKVQIGCGEHMSRGFDGPHFFRFLFDLFRSDVGRCTIIIIVIDRPIEFTVDWRRIPCTREAERLERRGKNLNVCLTLGFCRAFDSIFIQADSRSRSFSFSFCFSSLYLCEHSSNNLWFISMNNFNAFVNQAMNRSRRWTERQDILHERTSRWPTYSSVL